MHHRLINRGLGALVLTGALIGASACAAQLPEREPTTLVENARPGLLLAGTSPENRIAIQPAVLGGAELDTLELQLDSRSMGGSSATFEVHVVGQGLDGDVDVTDTGFASDERPWSRVVKLGRMTESEEAHVDVHLRVETVEVTQRVVIRRIGEHRYRVGAMAAPDEPASEPGAE